MPRNIVLAVVWRLLLLAAAVGVILAVGVYQFQWRPFGGKTIVENPVNRLDEILKRRLEENVGKDKETKETPPVYIEPTPAPIPKSEPTPEPKPEKKTKAASTPAPEDELTDFLDKELKKKKK